jgi:DNA-binding IclR family transcriptional regulator
MIRENNPDYSVRSVDIVIDTLEFIAAEQTTQVTVTRLCAALGISRNKAYRLLATLEKRGMVERAPGSGSYQLGICAAWLSQKILSSTSIIKHAHPVMKDLAKKHDEAIYMTVLKGDEVMFLDMVDCDQKVKSAALIGRSFPFFSNAAGKVIKAFESRDMGKVFSKQKRQKIQCDLSQLESELNDIRVKGVAVDCNGLGEDIISVAVAVKDYAGKVVGAITLLGPSFRMLADRLENEIIPSLLEGADMLSMKFGYAKF